MLKIKKNILEFRKDNEWTPKKNDKNWIKTEEYYEYAKLPEIEYRVTNELIKRVKECIGYINELRENGYHLHTKSITPNNIIKIIKFYDNEYSFVCYSSHTMEFVLKEKLITYFLKGKNDQINQFKNVKNIKCKLLACYKDISRTYLIKIKKQFMENEKISNNIFTVYKKIISNHIPDNIKKSRYYIYRLVNKDDGNEQYIFNSQEHPPLSRKQINELIELKHIIFSNRSNIKVEFLDENDYVLECQVNLDTDKFINEYDSIKNGLNKNYLLYNSEIKIQKKLEEYLFITIQMDIINSTNFEKIPKKYDGYVSYLEYDNEKYIFNGNNSIRQKLLEIYYDVLLKHSNVKKLSSILKQIKFTDLTIKILEFVENKDELENRTKFYISQLKPKLNENKIIYAKRK